MLPAAWVWLAALPLTSNGKLDRKSLPRPETDHRELAADLVAPRSAMERILAAAWCEVLGTGAVGIHDNFFDLGGHSLLAARLIARIEDRLGVALPLRTLFEAPTVAAFAARIEPGVGSAGLRSPLAAGLRPEVLPLSFAQERLWFLDQLEPGGSAYNIPSAFLLSGPLDVGVLASSLSEVLRRHEALRTTFVAVEGRPVQQINPPVPVSIPVVDLAGLADGKRRAEAARLTAEEVRRPFDLARGPLVRIALLRLGSGEHQVLLNLHHIVADGWSMDVLVRELTALYAGASPPELPVQYADYALWQRGWLQGEPLEAQLAWWRRQLAAAPASLDLPFDHPRSAVRDRRGGEVRLRLPEELAAALEALSRQSGATLFMTLLAGWSALLGRYASQEDVLAGSPVANRSRVETEGLIGFFVNTLVLRTDLSGDPGFGELVVRARRAALDAFEHQDLPFERLVEELQPERHPAQTPLYQALFALQNTPPPSFDLPGLAVAPVPLPAGEAKLEVSLSLEQDGEGISGSLRYAAGLFDAVTMQRAAGHLHALLAGAVAAPGTRLSLLPLLTEAESAQTTVEWNDTGRLRPGSTFPERFAVWAARTPGAPAVVFEGEVLTYGELDAQAGRLAARLRRMGVGPEVRAGILLERSAEMIVAMLAVLQAGGSYVPLEPTTPPERLARIAGHSGMALALTRGTSAARLPRSLPILALDEEPPQGARRPFAPIAPIDPQSAAYVIYTSGSTGLPKGVVVEHRQVASYLDGVLQRLDLPAGASFATVSTFAADLGNTMIFAALATGGCLHVIAQDRLVDGGRLADCFERHPVDCLKIVPSHLAALLTARHAGRLLPRRLLVLGGEASHWQDLDLLGRLAPGCRVLNHYGPTEATVGVITFEPARSAAPRRSPVVPLGRPLAGSRAYLLGAHGAPVPAGVPGELFLGGDNVARGYLAAPALTAERFLPDPFAGEAGARMYRTGDLVRHLPDGNLVFLGRIDHQVKIRGFRVEPGEVEACLLAHPAVSDCVVTARQESGGERRLVAYLVPAGESDLPAGTLRDFLRRSLPAYMLPSSFVFMPSLPLTPNGKVDRSALPAPEAGGAPGRVYVAPRNAVEELLAELWAAVLRVERVGSEDDFFELGGHSLLAFELITRIEAALGVRLPVRALFEDPSLAGLAERVAGEMALQAGDELLAQAWADDVADERAPVPYDGGAA